jgi:hypothetical protein
VSFVVAANDIDTPWYFQPGTATGNPCMGVPGALYPQGMGNNSDIVGQRRWYTPFILRRRTKFIGHNIVTGATIQTGTHLKMGIYQWDAANAKPTTLYGEVDTGVVVASTEYHPDYSTPLWLDPGYYAYAYLCTTTGTNIIFCTEYAMDGVWDFSVSANAFKRPMLYGENATGLTTLANPNTAAVVGYSSMAAAAIGLTVAARVMYLTRFQD